MFYWKIKVFKTAEDMNKWVKANSNKYNIRQIFINNKWAVEYKDLIKM